MGGLTSLPLDAPGPTVDFDYRIDVGSLLRRIFSVWWRNLVPFTMLAALVQSPKFVCAALLFRWPPGSGAFPTIGIAYSVLDSVLGFVVTGALTFGVFQDLRGRRPTFREIVGVGFTRLFRVLGVSILVGLSVVLGMCALIVPGLIAMVAYCVAIPVVVVEDLGPMAALRRSSELSTGNRWPILGILLVVHVLSYGAMKATLAVAPAVVHAAGFGEQPVLTVHAIAAWLMLPFAALSAVPEVVVYHDLRTGKEGADIEELVKVFD
jgi:hypothetical protein